MSPRVPGGMVAEVAALEAEIASLKDQRTSLTSEGGRLRIELNAEANARRLLTRDITTVRHELAAVTAERDDLAAQRDRLADEVQRRAVERDQLVVERGVLLGFVAVGQIPALRAHLRALRPEASW